MDEKGDINLKKMLKRKSKGFTLVELPIVLSSLVSLPDDDAFTGSATAKAAATKIVSDSAT